MKRAEIRATVETYLDRLGFDRGTWLWQSATLLMVLPTGKVIKVKLASGISAKTLSFELGRIGGIRETLKMLGLWPADQKPNGIGRVNGSVWTAPHVPAFAGIPA